MGGWRVGMAVGNETVIGYMATYKSQADTAHFLPIINASIVCMIVTTTAYQKTLTSDCTKSLVWNAFLKFSMPLNTGAVKMS